MMTWEIPEEVIERHLEQTERVVWAAQPLQGVRLRPYDVFLIPFSLLWGGFAIFWELMALGILFAHGESEGAPGALRIMFPLFGLPFVLVGLYLIFGRFIVDARRRSRTFYGVTNERVIIVSGLISENVKSINLRTLSDLSMSQKSDGTGTITFGPTHPFASFFGGGSWPGAGAYASPSFELVQDVAHVYEIIREAQKSA
jgi:hypothetical protein